MSIALQLQKIKRPGYQVELFVPDAQAVQAAYFQQKRVQVNVPFPHWTKLWPAGIALADYIHEHPEWVQGKRVLELAAGLGLPSMVAGRYAQEVCCSDYLPEAVEAIEQSARHAQLSNFTARLLDWNHLPHDLTAEVLLLADINYDPEQFDRLYTVLLRFLAQGTTILLTTPQRLMAKPFIEKLLPLCTSQKELVVVKDGQETMVSLLVME
ncbi:class I SAM-dependent methyltransferase [Paraflavitalea pollutisoli]|uniref:class I SAM-dependent methyltransferase n=1 Tax=Paraflavitalea pollutisoli TaxID=3034143 RepID=UPI0023EDA38A|nr:hypothetical protein [Paraflavitalea sp. H1-2-19X]